MDPHLEFHVDATPIGKATISLLVAYDYLHSLKMVPATETTWFPVTMFRKKDSGFREKLEDIDMCKGCMRCPMSGRTLFECDDSTRRRGWPSLV